MPESTSLPVLALEDVGLICGWRFACGDSEPAAALSAADAADWLARDAAEHPHSGDFLWLHFNLANAQSLRWLQRHAALPEVFYAALREGLASTRLERAEGSLVAVLNDVNFEFDFESADIATLWICLDERLVITARTQPLRSVDALRAAVRSGDSPASTTELLEHLMRTQADVLVKVVRETTARVDEIEDVILARRDSRPRAHLGRLRRLLVRLQRLLAPEPAALFRLLQQPPGWMSERDRQGLAAASEEFSLMLRDMQTLQDRIRLLQEEVAAIVNEDNNRSLFVLTMVTVLALPINILAGLFGMNVGGIPLAEHPDGFWIVVSIVVAFTAVAAWLAHRHKQRQV
ncbi:magnesium transporter CorA [Comamonas serinivorans]|uniref:Magnesium transporter CorA n=1 Tax=Comamonas serinivorans TaxID=1082851 RepID=A0A1Y0ESW0_9BURK|nr:transporter [Comamonas serinivorans]ARU06757.1 magnesium transporter CorA [Comamonas serinivorans]